MSETTRPKQMRLPGVPQRPRRKPRVMMHIVDAGLGDCVLDDPGDFLARFECRRCGHDSGWLVIGSVTEGKRGKPCPACNRLLDTTEHNETPEGSQP